MAIAIGVDPTVVLASITKFPYGTDEFAVAGGLRGEALRWYVAKPSISMCPRLRRSCWKDSFAPVIASQKDRSASFQGI